MTPAHRCEWLNDYTVLRHHCPIGTCPWVHDEDDETGEDPGIGEILEAHAATHTPEEWAREIDRLRHDLERAQDALRRRGIATD